MDPLDPYRNAAITQLASLTVLPIWFPFLAKSNRQRAEIFLSKIPNDLSHTNYFKNRWNYYKGITANLPIQVLFPIMDFVLNTSLSIIKNTQKRDPNNLEKMGASYLTGMTSIFIANPVVVTELATQKYRIEPMKAVKRVYREVGIKGFYKGSSLMAFRNGAFFTSLFFGQPYMFKEIKANYPNMNTSQTLLANIVAAVVPSFIYTTAIAPLDLTVILKQSTPEGNQHSSTIQTLKEIYYKHGLKSLKTGLPMRITACCLELGWFQFFKQKYEEIADNL
ncbi:MAG: hypothetical protein JHC93_03740 [Parachlamydiales bacterium]|nr:hypothetical protein [Parachlamydiales bacterium]